MTDLGWVIERYHNSTLEYWCGHAVTGSCGGADWRPGHYDAVRFCREQDASMVLAWLLNGEGRAVQHAWSSPPLSAEER